MAEVKINRFFSFPTYKKLCCKGAPNRPSGKKRHTHRHPFSFLQELNEGFARGGFLRLLFLEKIDF